MSSDKTRAERIEEAATKFCDAARCSAVIGPHHEFQELEEALALPPDPPRCDGWEALRELRAWVEREIDPADRQQSVLDEIDRLLAAAPKETP